MQTAITDLITAYGGQRGAAAALGVTDRTIRNYVKNPSNIPAPMQKLILLKAREASEDAPPEAPPAASPVHHAGSEARA